MFRRWMFDAEDLAGPLKLFRAIEKNGAVSPETLVMGPWAARWLVGGPGDKLGNLDFASKTGEYFRETSSCRSFSNTSRAKATG